MTDFSENMDELFFRYFENDLSDEEKKWVEKAVQEDKELYEEFMYWKNSFLIDPKISYPKEKQLLKRGNTGIWTSFTILCTLAFLWGTINYFYTSEKSVEVPFKENVNQGIGIAPKETPQPRITEVEDLKGDRKKVERDVEQKEMISNEEKSSLSTPKNGEKERNGLVAEKRVKDELLRLKSLRAIEIPSTDSPQNSPHIKNAPSINNDLLSDPNEDQSNNNKKKKKLFKPTTVIPIE